MLLTSSNALAARVRDLNRYDNRQDGELRYNYQANDLSAGLALAQWRKLPAFLRRRRALAGRYDRTLPQPRPVIAAGAKPSYHNYLILAKNAKAFMSRARRLGVWCDPPVFAPLRRGLPGCEEAFARAVALPLYPALRESEVKTLLEKARMLS